MLQSSILKRSSVLTSIADGRSPALRAGARGEQVVSVQLALASLGAPLSRSTNDRAKVPDGIWGPETEAAVREFQRVHGLVEDVRVQRRAHE